MRIPPGFTAVLDEPFPETAEIIERKLAIRRTAGLIHEPVETAQSWLDHMDNHFSDRRNRDD